MQEQAELIGGRFAAGRAVGGEMGFPGFDVTFRAAAPAIDVLVKDLRPAAFEIGYDEPCIGSVFTRFDARDDALDAAPTCGAVVKLLEAAQLGRLRPGLEARLCACLQRFDMATQRRGRRRAEDEAKAVRPAEVDDLGAAIMAVGAERSAACGRRPRS